MNVVLVHNYYQQRGGEDRVFEAEAALLAQRGHTVSSVAVHNDEVDQVSKAQLAAETIWNHRAYRDLRAHFEAHRPDVVHVHNTLPLVSPSVYYAARAEGAAVVQTLHNYRLVCPNGLMLREGVPCSLCVGRLAPLPGVVHACYRESRAATSVVASMLFAHRALGTYRRLVDRYLSLSMHARSVFIAGGFPADRVDVKHNFLPEDPGVGQGGGDALYVGRLSDEKGLRVLLEAWRVRSHEVPLRIAGDGPLASYVASAAAEIEGVTFLGRLSLEDVAAEMKRAMLVVVPSVWLEPFGLVVIESFAAGTPVVASNLGALPELVADGRSGYLFDPGDARALAATVARAAANPDFSTTFRSAARTEYESKYSAEVGYRDLVAAYQRAIESRRATLPGGR